MEPILIYGFPLGSSMGLVAALEWLGKPYRLCRVDMFGEMREPSYARINPRHETPAFITDEGSVLTETMAIAAWLEARDADRRISFDPRSREADRMHQLMAFVNTGFTGAFSPLWAAMEMETPDPATQSALRGWAGRRSSTATTSSKAMIGGTRICSATGRPSPTLCSSAWRAGSTSTPSRTRTAGRSWPPCAGGSKPTPPSFMRRPWRRAGQVRERVPASATRRFSTSSIASVDSAIAERSQVVGLEHQAGGATRSNRCS